MIMPGTLHPGGKAAFFTAAFITRGLVLGVNCFVFDGTDIVPLTWYDAGVRHSYSRIPIEKVKDLSGRRICVQESALMQDQVRFLGAVLYTSVFNDVYSLLETGAVDVIVNNWNSCESKEH